MATMTTARPGLADQRGLTWWHSARMGKFRRSAADLTHRSVMGVPLVLRLDGDSDDPATWHPVKVISAQGFRTDTSQPFVRALTVSFHDGTPDVMFNETDEVEFALPRPQPIADP
jgi:hypothetical protein